MVRNNTFCLMEIKDVYKRQTLQTTVVTSIYVTTVSYTHLDVYKRQIPCLFMIAASYSS